jgi:hypothetical protein
MYPEASLAYEPGDGSAATAVAVEQAKQRRFLPLDLLTGAVGDEYPLLEDLRAGGLSDDALAFFADNPTRMDLLGVNYYPTFGTTCLTATGPDRVREEPRDRWTAGLESVIRDYQAHFRVPVTVSETSLDGSLGDRMAWLRDSLALVRRLRAEGLPLRGFTWWPVIDMIGWEYRTSTAPVASHVATMGLFDLVPEPGGGFARRANALLDLFRAQVAAGDST